MRIASYNLWNSDVGMPIRAQQLVTEIQTVQADILCLQEVTDRAHYEFISRALDFPYTCFRNHKNEREGLAILSRYPITRPKYTSHAAIVSITLEDKKIALSNIHLDWNSALNREKDIIEIVKNVAALKADYSFIAGDFNCSPHSSVHQFLLGQQSLFHREAKPYWIDLAESFGCTKGIPPEVTVDFMSNPRWQKENSLEVSQRFDRILMMNPYPRDFPRLLLFDTFGKSVDSQTGLAPSDHWGVFADLLL